MDPSNVGASILWKRIRDHRTDAKEHRPQKAATAYREAADALSALADLKGVDRDDDIAQLRRAAERL
jgi:hypothetical protein